MKCISRAGMLASVLVLGSLMLAACGEAQTRGVGRQPSAGLLVAHDHAVYLHDPTSGAEQLLLTVPDDHLVTSLSWSPDGTQFAYVSTKPATKWKDIPADEGSDLYVAAADGENQRLILTHDQPGATISSLAWTAGGTGLVYTYAPGFDPTHAGSAVRRRDLASSIDSALVEGAEGADLCQDGSRLAFVRGGRLWLADGDGQQARQVATDKLPVASSRPIASDAVSVEGRPLFSPDCTRLTFGGSFTVTGPVDNGPYLGHVPLLSASGRWTIGIDATDGRQVPADSAAWCVTWAADGRALLALNGLGLLRVPVNGDPSEHLGPGSTTCDAMA